MFGNAISYIVNDWASQRILIRDFIMRVEEKIRANAELTIKMLGPLSDVTNFGYNFDSVKWVEGFIERQRVRSDLSKEEISQPKQDGWALAALIEDSNPGAYEFGATTQ